MQFSRPYLFLSSLFFIVDSILLFNKLEIRIIQKAPFESTFIESSDTSSVHHGDCITYTV